ncbi:KxYKxGKxW signal peptide domain-containing protein [uncultured Limosilactobacillus sp.]|uniref:KxYKxGKxW signal peptide domain-containing protein n=1 Tax=uncultured Limosilactobacillus sp. TaxID=2837629 RepID=UPI0025D7DF3B|nr:KxYKxGKxW signal peptide domain-containing protein [uncultured Limosilactobacillus sp.]
MQNNKLRFKMYKSGKNWMVAGLMTTAVLAGLTLSNANGDVVAHADVNAPKTTQVASQKQEVSQDQYNDQKAKVATDQTNVDNAQKDVDAAQTAVDNAKKANENAAKVNDAKTAWKNAEADYTKANSDYNKAHKATADAKAAYDQANAYKNNWDKNEDALYNKLQDQISTSTATKTDNEKVAKDETAAAKKDDAAYDATAKLQAEAQAKLDALNADHKATAEQKQDAADYNQSLLDQLNSLYQDSQKHKKAAEDANKAVANADKTIRNANKILAPKTDRNPAGRDLLGHKKAADSAADKKVAYETALQHEKDLKAVRDAARLTANAKKAAYTQARADYNLPNDAEYAEMQKKATGARQKINSDKADPAYTKVTELEGHVKDAKKVLDNAKKAVDGVQAKVDAQNDKLAKAQADLDAAKADAAKNTNDDVLASKVIQKQSIVNAIKARLHGADGKDTAGLMHDLAAAKENVKNREGALAWWQKKLDGAKADARYQKLVSDIKYRQSIIDKADQAKANRAAAKDVDEAVAPLEAVLAQKQGVLKTYQDALKADTDILNNMAVKGQADSGKDTPKGDDTKKDDSKKDDAKSDDTKADVKKDDAKSDAKSAAKTDVKSAKTGVRQVAMTRAQYRNLKSAADQNDTKANNEAKLPQTGNNDSAAVLALGAVSAMLGLGMVAKKREF